MIIELTPEEIKHALFGLQHSSIVNEAIICKVIEKLQDAVNDIEHNKKINDENN